MKLIQKHKNWQENLKFAVKVQEKANELYPGLFKPIILRNSEGIYVLTPSLNKSFKFQSEWPYNSSQTYLLQTLLYLVVQLFNHVFHKN